MAIRAANGQDNTSTTNNDAGPRLGRRQSVRFTGPTAIPSRSRSITRRDAPGQLQSQSQSIELSIPSNKRMSRALAQPVEEFGESDNASVPSSYRRLRKAKSMFSPDKAPSAVFSEGISHSRRHFHRQSLTSSDTHNEPLRVPDPRLRKSYSFLRGVTDRISTGSRQYVTNDAAIQLARDQYLRQLEQQRLKEQPLFLGFGNRCKPQKAFRRTVRTSSTNSYGSAVASPSVPVESPKIKDLGHRARSLSQTIKKKIKRVFKRSSDTEGPIPVQQIQATYPHYGDYDSTSDGKEQHYLPVPEPDAELLLRVSSRESVTYTEPIFVDQGGGLGSIRTAHSDDDETNGKSRVTSWTDSTAANTIHIPQTLERKRLSIIKEDGGPHQPSCSARQYEGTSDGYASFRQPVRQGSAGRVSGPIDTQRIFSALQKKIDENNREAALDDSESGTDSSSSHRKVRPSTRAPKRTSSIRKGAKAKSNAFSRSRAVNKSNPDIFSSSAIGSPNHYSYQQESQGTNRQYYQQAISEFRKGLTPQQSVAMNENGNPLSKGPLREVKSAFFPPSMRIERSNTSPYRRAMQLSSDTEGDSQRRVSFGDRSRFDGSSNAVTGQLRSGSVAGSDSIYSRSSGGDPKMTESSMSLAISESSGEAGTAIIITNRHGENEQSGHLAFSQPGSSSVASSGNWKNFMATQVASLEARQTQNDDAHAIKDTGHRRENAQVNSDEISIGRLQPSIDILNQPLAIIQGNGNPRTASKHNVSQSLGERSPLMSIDPPNIALDVNQDENAPLSKGPEHSRKNSTMENEGCSLSRVHEVSGGLRQKNSRSSLKKRAEQRGSPHTANVRYTPDRAERLRRLKRSSSTSLGTPLSQIENQASSPGLEDHDSKKPDTTSNGLQTQAGKNHKLVDSFLRGRRSAMRFSDESGTNPAFL